MIAVSSTRTLMYACTLDIKFIIHLLNIEIIIWCSLLWDNRGSNSEHTTVINTHIYCSYNIIQRTFHIQRRQRVNISSTSPEEWYIQYCIHWNTWCYINPSHGHFIYKQLHRGNGYACQTHHQALKYCILNMYLVRHSLLNHTSVSAEILQFFTVNLKFSHFGPHTQLVKVTLHQSHAPSINLYPVEHRNRIM